MFINKFRYNEREVDFSIGLIPTELNFMNLGESITPTKDIILDAIEYVLMGYNSHLNNEEVIALVKSMLNRDCNVSCDFITPISDLKNNPIIYHRFKPYPPLNINLDDSFKQSTVGKSTLRLLEIDVTAKELSVSQLAGLTLINGLYKLSNGKPAIILIDDFDKFPKIMGLVDIIKKYFHKNQYIVTSSERSLLHVMFHSSRHIYLK